ncbi:cysteine-rich CWC family protein [Spirosoma harenae]
MNLPSKPEHTACPRCERSFECRAGSVNLCQCQPVQLTESQRQYIGSLFQGCLCADCLRTLQAEYGQLTTSEV